MAWELLAYKSCCCRLRFATCSLKSFWYCSFDLYTGSTFVRHVLRSTSSPSATLGEERSSPSVRLFGSRFRPQTLQVVSIGVAVTIVHEAAVARMHSEHTARVLDRAPVLLCS